MKFRFRCNCKPVAEVDAYAPAFGFWLLGCCCGVGDGGGCGEAEGFRADAEAVEAGAVAADPGLIVGAGVVALLYGEADVDGVGDAEGIGADGAVVPVRRDRDGYGDCADGVGGCGLWPGYVYGVTDDEGVCDGVDFRGLCAPGGAPALDQCGCEGQAQDGEGCGDVSVCCCGHGFGMLG